MAKAGQRKWMSCGEFLLPDHRSGERQRYCCAAACRRASKAASQASWLARPPNRDYLAAPCTSRVCRSGATRIRVTAALGCGRRGRYKIACRRKCLIRLRNVLSLPRRPRPWRSKIS